MIFIGACRQAEARRLDPEALGADVSLVKDLFLVHHRATRAGIEKSSLIDQHFEEWRSRGLRAENGSHTPWQKELLRLEEQLKATQNDIAVAKQKLMQGRVQE